MKLSVPQLPLIGLSLLAVSSLVVNSSPFIAFSAPASSSDRYLEVRETKGKVTSQGRSVKVGDRIKQSSGISTSLGSNTVLVADDGIGTINVAQNTNLQVKSLKTLPDGSKTTRLYMAQGQARSKVRPFTNRQSSYEIETPGGVAGTRGTEFGVTVSPDGKTGLSTIKGTIALTAQGKTVLVEPGFSALIIPGQAPSLPQMTTADTRVKLQVLSIPDQSQVRVTGNVDPINLVLLNDQVVDTGGEGKLDVVVPLPANRQITLVVRTPLGNQQIYELEVPQAGTPDGSQK